MNHVGEEKKRKEKQVESIFALLCNLTNLLCSLVGQSLCVDQANELKFSQKRKPEEKTRAGLLLLESFLFSGFEAA